MKTRLLQAWPRLLGQANSALTRVAGIAMMLMVLIIIASVLMRYVLGQPMLGSNELIQLTSVILVMAALPYCTEQDGHIRVDVFDRVLGRWGRFAGDVIFRVLSIFVLGALTWRALLKAADTFKWGDATNMLSLPLWPLYLVLAAGSALCVLVFITQFVQVVLKRASA